MKTNIKKVNGLYYSLCDEFGEIEFTDNIDVIKQLYKYYKTQKKQIRLYKQEFKNGRLVNESEVIYNESGTI